MLPSEHYELGLQLLETAIVSTKNNKMLPALKKMWMFPLIQKLSDFKG